ncbi:MAG TPA: histidine kinase, partial [Bacteroidales bacterium]|nr:histidine kinase [Bacteroidales bacterium]
MYTISIKSEKPEIKGTTDYYHDVDSDGYTERMMYYRPSSNTTSIIVYSHTGGIINQHNFRGVLVEKADVFYTDYDSDSLVEMNIFTHSADSLFINTFEPAAEESNNDLTRFVDIAPLQDGEAKYRISGGPQEDVNGDGINEIYFAVSAGFTLQPRNVYYFDIPGDKIRKSPCSGSGPRYELLGEDIDGDGFIELWGKVSAHGNVKKEIPYPDRKAWLMVFNHLLDFEFAPVPFSGHPSIAIPRLLKTGQGNRLAVLLDNRGVADNCCDRLMLFTPRGEKLADLEASELGLNRIDNIFIEGSGILLHDWEDGVIVRCGPELKTRASFSGKLLGGNVKGPYDMDSNGKHEYISFIDYSLHLIDIRGKSLASTVFENSGSLKTDPVHINNYQGFSGILLKASEKNYLLSLETRRKWLIYSIKVIVVFLLVYLFVFLIQHIQVRQERKKQLIEKTLREYQLVAIKKQINPHFIFNALTSISAMNFRNRQDEANDYLVKFSHLMREVVDSSDKNIVKLKDEIAFIKKYLDVENIRMGPSLVYNIVLPPEFENVEVPSM